MKYILYILIGLAILKLLSHNPDDKENLYVMYISNTKIKCNYIDSRGDNKGIYAQYFELGKEQPNWILKSKIDSIIVISEDWWTCGPRDKKIKYIGINTHN